jgi:photosystem II stability/assembly factor-like uncharacterized protein
MRKIWVIAVAWGASLSGAPKTVDAGGALARIPQFFEPASGGGFVTPRGARITPGEVALGPHTIRLEGANRDARGVGEEPLPGRSNYFFGNDPRLWRTNVPNYARIRYRNVYPGIDVVYYGHGRDLEFDFVVAPGADPRRIRLALSSPELRLQEPRIYQGDREIAGRAVRNGNRVRFELAEYDRTQSLVIDPVIGFATLLGGEAGDSARAIAVDPAGATYIAGVSTSLNFPSRVPPVYLGGMHAFVIKLSPDGSTVLYSTYLGGGHGTCISNPCLTIPTAAAEDDEANTIAVDASGNAYVAGLTTSPDFPAVNASQPFRGGRSGFITKFGTNGAVIFYSTFLGGTGTNNAHGIAVDAGGNAYVTGETNSDDFPVRAAYQSTHLGHLDAFVTKFSPGGSIIFSTYFGGATDDVGQAIAVGNDGAVYVTGWTYSMDFPVVNALRPYPLGGGDAFITKFSLDGASLVWSTLVGGTGIDSGTSITVDGAGNVYVAGTTSSRDMATVNALQAVSSNPVMLKSVDGAASFAQSDAGLPGNAFALAVDPVAGTTVYATVGGSVFKSSDAGGTWRRLALSGVSIAIDPSAPSTVYVGALGSIAKTTDGGETWKGLEYGGALAQVLAVDPKNSSVIYAGSGAGQSLDGLYKSTDGGETWTRLGSASGAQMALKALAIDPTNTQVLYANIGNLLFKSTDGGTSWGPPVFLGGAKVIVIDGSGAIYVLYVKSTYGAIFKSTDGGQSWAKVLDLSSTTVVLPDNISGFVADTSKPSTLFVATPYGVVRTSDGFAHWEVANPLGTVTNLAVGAGILYAASPPGTDAFVVKLNADAQSYAYWTYLGGTGQNSAATIAVDASGNAYVGGATSANNFPMRNAFTAARSAETDGFVAKIAPDGSALVYSSYVGATVAALALGPDGGAQLAGGWSSPTFFTDQPILQYHSHSVFRSDDAGGSWSGIASSSPGTLTSFVVDPQNSNHVFAIYAGGAVYVSNDAGLSWRNFRNSGVFALAIDPQTPSTVWISGGLGIQKSTDGGITFHMTQGGPIAALSIVADPTNAGILYAGGSPATSANITVYKSVDGGESWQPLNSPQPVPAGVIRDQTVYLLAIDSRGGLYALTSGQVFKSVDSGVNWAALNFSSPVTSLVLDPKNASTLYVFGTSGLYRSLDGGATFLRISDPVQALTVDPSSPATLYAASQHGGILKSSDRGNTWSPTGLSIPLATAITVDPTNPSRIYVATRIDPMDVFVLKIME